MANPHDRPSADELLESVREWLEKDVMASSDTRLAFHARVAANIIEIVRREYSLAPEIDARYDHVLSTLGVLNEQELVDRIRQGHYDDQLGELLATLRPVVDDKVAVANPRYIAD